ncbi:Bud site selection protein bud4 [Coemansia sp. BCRC 34490]|nr:Bud site selection protein bud4 [Coemansia sp. BCRC 34490]
MASMSADQMKEHVAVREVILGALIDSISPEQLDSHFFGRQKNTTLHLAAFYNDANLVERLLRQGAAVDIPNRMGFLPSGITNDKPTLQWLAMYQGQVRGTRYQSPQAASMPQERSMHYYSPDDTPESDNYMDEADGADVLDPSPMSVPDSPRTKAAEEEFNIGPYDQFSENGDMVSESSYIKQFADSIREMNPPTPEGSPERMESSYADDGFDDKDSEDDSSEDDQTDSGSVVSSSDRSSLGLGGVKGNQSSKSLDSAPMRKRALENSLYNKDSSRPNSRGSNVSNSNHSGKPDSPSSLHHPMSSNGSFHTANGVAFSDGIVSPAANADFDDHVMEDEGQQESAPSDSANSTMRLKEDLSSLDVSKLEDIFSDDDEMVQFEPSYYRSGSGLSSTNGSVSRNDRSAPAKHTSLVSSDSSSGSINMRSLNNAMAMASLTSKTTTPASTAISAFPVMIHESGSRGIDDSGRPLKALEQLKQHDSASKGDNNSKRPASPFLLRDSLYEMIMGKTTTSRQSSLASVGSANSIAYSNTSTVNVAKDSQSSSGPMPISPTSPTSPNSHVSPSSTTFDGSSGSPSQTVISSPTNDTGFGTTSNLAPQVPETVKENSSSKSGRDAGALSRSLTQPNVKRSDPISNTHSSGIHHRMVEDEHDMAAGDFEGDGAISSRSSSPVAAPRPTAASLFAMPDELLASNVDAETINLEDMAGAYAGDDNNVSSSDQASPEFHTPTIGEPEYKDDDNAFPALPSSDFNAGRIGRRQGRATAELLGDEESGFSSEPTFSFVKQKMSMENIDDKPPKKEASENELESPTIEPSELPADVPLTRDKRDQYLQTLINRNTMRSGSPGKRSARMGIANALRADMPTRSNGASDGVESSDDGDTDSYSANQPSAAFSHYRHSYKRSESALDFMHSRSPSALGVRSRDAEVGLRGSPSRQHSREASVPSTTPTIGRTRSNTLANVAPNFASSPSQPLPRPASSARKVSPSLASLKTRNLVSNSPAKFTTGNTPEKTPTPDSVEDFSPTINHSPLLNSSRIRAMSTPVDAVPPQVQVVGRNVENARSSKPVSLLSGTSTARIGRVAALSQNFERQVGASPPKLTISMRSVTAAVAEMEFKEKGGSGVVSAPLGGLNKGFSRPAARSNSISSSHSAGGHGQSMAAAGESAGTREEHANNGGDKDVPGGVDDKQSGDANDYGADGGAGGGSGIGGGTGAGGAGNNSGGDDDKPSPNPRAAILDSVGTDSNGSTSTHTSSPVPGRGLAANLRDSPSMLFDSRGSSDHVGSSIFSSTESKSSSSKELLHQSDPSQMNTHAAARPDPEAERKKRFRDLANRRKSGTLERISNRGFVKSRKALLTSSDSNVQSPPQSSGRSSAKSRKARAQLASSDAGPSRASSKGTSHASSSRHQPRSRIESRGDKNDDGKATASTSAAAADTAPFSFLGRRGEEQASGSGGSSIAAATRSAQVNIAPVGVDRPLSRSHAALPPSDERIGIAQNESTPVGENVGLAVIASTSEHPLEAALEQSLRVESDNAAILSRGSSGGKSGFGSGSGEDSSLHILSSLDTLSTPESTPLDSAPENTNVGLLAQYNMNPKRFERRMKGRLSDKGKHSYYSSERDTREQFEGTGSTSTNPPPQPASDVDLGFRTISDTEDDPYAIDPEQNRNDLLQENDAPETSGEHQSEGGVEPVEFHTLMPSRPRYNTKALFGLSTVEEEDEESRGASIAVSDIKKTSSVEDITNSGEVLGHSSRQSLHKNRSQDSWLNDIEVRHDVEQNDSYEVDDNGSRTKPLRGLRAAIDQIQRNRQLAPVYQGLGSTGIPEADQIDPPRSPRSPAFSGLGGASSGSFILDDDSQSRTPSLGSNSYDPNVIFGYTSEENSTMASRTSFERSDLFGSNRPGSAASHVIYMQPLDVPETETGQLPENDSRSRVPVPSTSRGGPRRRLEKSSLSNLSFEKADDEASSNGSNSIGKGKGVDKSKGKSVDKGKGVEPRQPRIPEMEQVHPPVVSRPTHVTTVDELEADLSPDEEPIPKILFLHSQDFEGYRPAGLEIRDFLEEMRQERKKKKEAAKKGIKLPREKPKELLSPLWFMENSFIDPLTPREMQWLLAERDRLMIQDLRDNRVTEHPELKRTLDPAPSISSLRLREELDATMAEDDAQLSSVASRGTIKPLSKRPRMSDIQGMFEEPGAKVSDDEGSVDGKKGRRSFLDSVEIPVSESESESDSDGSVDQAQGQRQSFYDEAFVSPISQEFQVPGDKDHPIPEYDPSLLVPRKKLVLRTRGATFSERVMNEIDELDVKVKTDVMGTLNVHSAGQYSYETPAGTIRPSTIPQYVSPLNGVPAGPFFVPPKATSKSGYLYMRILSIEDIESKTDSVYFVIRNGIDTLATTPVTVAGTSGTTINQEFRILTDPEVSITMWMRFRSDAIIYKNGRGGDMSRRNMNDPGCVPPLLKRLIRRNTRSRGNRLNCSSSADSVFDFASVQPPRLAPGARKGAGGPAGRIMSAVSRNPMGPGYPERVSSALLSQSAQRYASERSGTQQNYSGFNDPRSFNATQAPSSVFYEPGSEMTGGYLPSHKGLAHAKFKEETSGVAVVHIGEMIDEVFLRGLVDSWDVENVWENRKGARLQLQLFYIPECPLFREEELPRTLSECEMAMEVCNFHNRTLNSGYMSQRGGDTRFWRRRYFRLIGGFLFAYHEETKEPRCFIDLNDATRIIDNQTDRVRRAAASPLVGSNQIFGSSELMRSARAQRRMTHKRNNSDHSARDGGAAGADIGARSPRQFAQAPGHEYASDSEPADYVDIADPTLQKMTMRRGRTQKKRARGEIHNSRDTEVAGSAAQQSAGGRTDSGIVSVSSSDGAADNGMHHSFSIEFGKGGSIEFYTESEHEKRVWVEIIKRVIGSIPKIPSWLIKLLHADVTDRIDGGTAGASESSIVNSSTPSSKFQDMVHPQELIVR